MSGSTALAMPDVAGELSWALERANDDPPPDAGDEAVVQDFVSLSMLRILQPFSDHLRTLQAETERLAEGLEALRSVDVGHGQRLLRQEEATAKLEAGAAETAAQLEKVVTELVALKRDKSRLEGNHEMTKASVVKTKELVATLQASVDAATGRLEQGTERSAGLERAVAEVESRILEQVEGRLDKQGRVCKEVNERTAGMVSACQQAKQLGQSATAAIKELTERAEKRWQDDSVALRGLSERVELSHARLGEAETALQSLGEGLKAADRELQHFATWTEQLKDVRSLEAAQVSARTQLEEQARRLDHAERDVMDIHSGPLRELLEKQVDVDLLRESLAAVTSEVKQITRWRESQRMHVDVLSNASQRLLEVEDGARSLAAQIEAVEGRVLEMAAWQDNVGPQLAEHRAALKQVASTADAAHEGVQATSTRLQSLGGELEREREGVSRLALRVEAVNKYFSGIGKGLQDTHRQLVSNDGGLLPPNKAGGTSLPSIPRTPRALKPAPPSPRRVPPLPAAKASDVQDR